MASVYTNDLRLEEIGSGEQSGTWGDTTNTNLELIAEAFSFGTEAITTNADTHTTTIADGATDPGRSMFLKYTGTLDSACTITIGPNTVSKLWFIENGTSGSQNIIISQGSGANITIPPGDTKAIYSDGAGSGAAMVDAFASLSVVDLKVQDDLTVTDDVAIGGLATVGGTLGVTGVLTTTAKAVSNGGIGMPDDAKLTFGGTGTGDLQIYHDGTHSYISDQGTGNLKILGAADVRIVKSDDSELSAKFVMDGAVELYHNNVKTFETTATGVNITGGFAAVQESTVLIADGQADNAYAFQIKNEESTDDRSYGLLIHAGSTATDRALAINTHDGNAALFYVQGNGQALFTDGTASLPSITNNGDTDTGLYFPAAGKVGIVSQGTESIRFSTSGDIFIQDVGNLSTITAGTSNLRIGVNAGDALGGSSSFNVLLGDEAGTALTNGSNNIAIGFRALKSEDGDGGNIAIGSDALENLNVGAGGNNVAIGNNVANDLTTGARNVIIGAIAGDQATTPDDSVIIGYNAGGNAVMTGNANTCIGKDAGQELSSGHSNCFVGKDAGTATATGLYNIAMGVDALATNNDGDGAVAIGYEALKTFEPADGQSYNVAIGYKAGKGVTTANTSVIIGGLTCQAAFTGSASVIIGTEAGNDLTAGTDNIAIGLAALDLEDVGSRNIAIGTNALGVSNQTGSTANNSANMAVGFAAGNSVTTGFHNTILGTECGQTIQDGARCTLVGKSVNVTASNVEDAIGLGNNIAVAANDFSFGKASNVVTNDFDADANWSRSSDERLKKNITNQTLGLDFINDLRTVKYNWKPSDELDANDAQLAHLRREDEDGNIINDMNTDVLMHNFIAQEVKTALDTAGVSEFGGWKEDQFGVQQVSREMFVIPLVKAVQELSTALDAALARIATLEG